MAKLMAPNMRIDWYPDEHFADHNNPTRDELNSGYNLSSAIITGYTLDFADSHTENTRTIFDTANSEAILRKVYEVSLQFFLATPGSEDPNELAYRQAEELFYNNTSSKGYFVKRFGYSCDTEYIRGQKFDLFYVESTKPRIYADDSGPILLEVMFIPKGFALSGQLVR